MQQSINRGCNRCCIGEAFGGGESLAGKQPDLVQADGPLSMG